MSERLARRVAKISPPHAARVVRDIVRGFPRWARRDGGVLNDERSKAYFLKRSFDDDQRNVVEITTDWYAAVLDSSQVLRERLENQPDARILDVGCGRGGLITWLQSHGHRAFTYFGVDRDPIAVKRCQSRFPDRTFSTGDAKDIVRIHPTGADIFFIVNVLPYVADPIGLLATCRALAGQPHPLLVVVDPAVSPYWNHEFSGVRPQYRSRSQLLKLMDGSGWVARELVQLAPMALLGVPLFQIAHLIACSPKR